MRLALLLPFIVACEPAYVPTWAPKEATFGLSCVDGCGPQGRDKAIVIDTHFGKKASRSFTLCCAERAAVAARLQTAQDMWCDGLPVPEKTVGDLTIGTTVSPLTGTRAATLNQGEGYVSFQCGGWLEQLNAELEKDACCSD